MWKNEKINKIDILPYKILYCSEVSIYAWKWRLSHWATFFEKIQFSWQIWKKWSTDTREMMLNCLELDFQARTSHRKIFPGWHNLAFLTDFTFSQAMHKQRGFKMTSEPLGNFFRKNSIFLADMEKMIYWHPGNYVKVFRARFSSTYKP